MSIFEATDHWGNRRFYAPGTHPATRKMRQQLKALEKAWIHAQERGRDIAPIQTNILRLKDTIAAWEEAHNEAKMNYFERMVRE